MRDKDLMIIVSPQSNKKMFYFNCDNLVKSKSLGG